MAVIIPRLKIELKPLHTARRKLQAKHAGNAVPLTSGEREALLSLITAGKKTLYPAPMTVDQYQYNLNEIAKVNRNKCPAQFDHFAGQIAAFEQKYCK